MVSVSRRRVVMVAFAFVASVASLTSPVVGGPHKWCHDDCDFAYSTCGGSYKECTDTFETCSAGCEKLMLPLFASVAEKPHEVAPTTVGDARCSHQCEEDDRSCRKTFSSGTPAAIAVCDDAWASCVTKCGVFQRPAAAAAALDLPQGPVASTPVLSDRDMCYRPCAVSLGQCTVQCDRLEGDAHAGCVEACTMPYNSCVDACDKRYLNLAESVTSATPATVGLYPCPAGSECAQCQMACLNFATDTNACLKDCPTKATLSTTPADETPADEAAAKAACYHDCLVAWTQCLVTCKPGDAVCYAKCATPSCQQQCEKPTPVASKIALASTEQATSGHECVKECKAKGKAASDKCRQVKWVNRSACYSAVPTMVKACETSCTHKPHQAVSSGTGSQY